ncbi:hypothetical protein AC578_8563 [Pseudocercospora eumusae]|uniref:Anaphase-promoting complex subunit 4 WD40 domain-containing protein n=1 Tax=Pseudocercospora eumusae TaxID=321146 RepID=A0A139HVY5_9PEZI|nr:hypothetical protein AC578_8563 [Pseudocercospora eumusae]
MADVPPRSSQDSFYQQNKISLDQENIPSSPPVPQSATASLFSSQKIRKPPTVTPNRFNKFFKPRKAVTTRGGRLSKAGRQLRDITKNGANRRAAGLSAADFLPTLQDDFSSPRPLKRRKHSGVDLDSSPPQSSPLKHHQTLQPIEIPECDSEAETLPELFEELGPFPRAVRRLREPGPSRRILERSFGGFHATSRGFRGADHAVDWRAETANICTSPSDVHMFSGTALPFCTTACNTNPLVAIGDEEGSVHLIDSSPAADFRKAHVKFRVHHNAVMDIAFCSDDYILATASGDQTARVVDMYSQQTMCILTGHKNSVKQVRFAPNDNNIITTSARDGCVNIWDLRCGGRSAVQNWRATAGSRVNGDGKVEPEARYGKSLEVGYGHRSANRTYETDNRDELSITSFQHLLNGREHMIVTSSEVDASIKLWDLRNAGRRNPMPLAGTPVPESHGSRRNFGVNTMALSGDGGRLYTICRDATIYAYSTNQLVLGYAPEMSSGPSRRRLLKEPMPGLGPLYGYQNPDLRLGSFYIKASLRPAKGDKSEMLAVGSTNGNPILFPTDERHVPRRERATDDDENDEHDLPSASPKSSQRTATPARSKSSSNLHVFEHGTALVRAHNKEVTSLAWSTDGDLVSVSDDFTARCWREDAGRAHALRTGGEDNGGRWQSGWAAVSADWDEGDW